MCRINIPRNYKGYCHKNHPDIFALIIGSCCALLSICGLIYSAYILYQIRLIKCATALIIY